MKLHKDESIQTLYFASRAKSIKNVAKQNVILNANELKYIANGLKKELMLLRGQVKKIGYQWKTIEDGKLLAFVTNEEYEEDGGRKINLDPGTLSESNIILATTKNRSHRIAIGQNLYAELTLMYKNHEYVSFPWTYSDYKSERVQNTLLEFRKEYLLMRKEVLKNKNKQN